MTRLSNPLKIFYCYAREDKRFHKELDIRLAVFMRQNLITTWYDQEIKPGEVWDKVIDAHIDSTHIFLLLVSPYFMASDYCYGKEMKQALERHKAGNSRVIPIVVSPVELQGTPLAELQMLPKEAKPITIWRKRDEAWSSVVQGIQTVIQDMIKTLNLDIELLEKESLREELAQPIDSNSIDISYNKTLVPSQQAGVGTITIHNNASVQNQNIGTNQQITQHFEQSPKAP